MKKKGTRQIVEESMELVRDKDKTWAELLRKLREDSISKIEKMKKDLSQATYSEKQAFIEGYNSALLDVIKEIE